MVVALGRTIFKYAFRRRRACRFATQQKPYCILSVPRCRRLTDGNGGKRVSIPHESLSAYNQESPQKYTSPSVNWWLGEMHDSRVENSRKMVTGIGDRHKKRPTIPDAIHTVLTLQPTRRVHVLFRIEAPKRVLPTRPDHCLKIAIVLVASGRSCPKQITIKVHSSLPASATGDSAKSSRPNIFRNQHTVSAP